MPLDFLGRLGIEEGQDVLDLGCGPGFWTFPLAEIVGPDGAVWALDVADEMLNALARQRPPAQVRIVQSKLPQIELPDQSVDWVWAAFVLHEVGALDALAAEVRRVVRPAGKVAVLDWRPDGESDEDPPRVHRVWPERIASAFQGAGFGAARRIWGDGDYYLIELTSGEAERSPRGPRIACSIPAAIAGKQDHVQSEGGTP